MFPDLPESVRRIAGPLRNFGFISVGALFALAGCASETLFQSSFNSNAVGDPPSPTQAFGTVQVEGAPGSVVIVQSVPTSNDSNHHWVQITSGANGQAPISAIQCNFTRTYADGIYGFLGVLFIPRDSGPVSVEFDTGPSATPPSASFLHLDFLPTGAVRFDGDSTDPFLHFPHGRYFTLSVRIDVTPTTQFAYVRLFGTGTLGRSGPYPIRGPDRVRQYGAIRLSMEYPGSFAATDLIVTRKR